MGRYEFSLGNYNLMRKSMRYLFRCVFRGRDTGQRPHHSTVGRVRYRRVGVADVIQPSIRAAHGAREKTRRTRPPACRPPRAERHARGRSGRPIDRYPAAEQWSLWRWSPRRIPWLYIHLRNVSAGVRYVGGISSAAAAIFSERPRPTALFYCQTGCSLLSRRESSRLKPVSVSWCTYEPYTATRRDIAMLHLLITTYSLRPIKNQYSTNVTYSNITNLDIRLFRFIVL